MGSHTVISWLNQHKERIGLIALGHTWKRTEEFLFDWLLYAVVTTYATARWGVVTGSLASFCILAPLSACISWGYLVFYDWLKKDWLGLEVLKELRDEEKHEHWLGHLLHRFMRLGAIPAFLFLSLHDPFMTTAYFRPKHRQYDGLTRRDWTIFTASVLVSNAYWTLRWVVIVEIVRFLWSGILVPLAAWLQWQ